MQLRGFSEGTISCYSIQCDCFLEFCKVRDTAKLTEKEFRTYLVHLTSRENLAPSSINQYNSAIRFLYEVTLEKDINYKRVPHAKVLSVPGRISTFSTQFEGEILRDSRKKVATKACADQVF